MVNLGVCYYNGSGVDKDMAKAVELYQKAADLGHANAMRKLGYCYYNGSGVEKDVEKAVELYQKAADLGNADAMYNLGLCYFYGSGVEQNVEKAVELYQMAADLGDADAMFKLGLCYDNGSGVKHDAEKAVELYQKAADLGDAGAMFNLALCYEDGIGVEKDVEKAVELYQKAADLGHAQAMYNLGVCYDTGNGVEKDMEKTVELYQKAAILGHAKAIHNLGMCYYDGIGVEQNVEMAVQLYQMAVNLGHARAMTDLGYCYQYCSGVTKDVGKAVKLYQKAADLGHATAMYNLGSCYFYGSGVEQNFDNALNYIKKARDSGEAEAYTFLGWAYRGLYAVCDGIDLASAQEHLKQANEKGSDGAKIFWAELLSVSTEEASLIQAIDLLDSNEATKDNVYARWLRPFLQDQLDYQMNTVVWKKQPEPDFIVDAAIQLVAKIGEGFFGKVFLGRYMKSEWVAVKYSSVSVVASDEDYARNILRERFTCRILAAHGTDGVVGYRGFVDDFGNAQRGLVFDLWADARHVMEKAQRIVDKGFVSARDCDLAELEKEYDWSDKVLSSLRQAVVFAPKKPPVTQIILMLQEVAKALHEVHKLGFIHRDIAARNILCDKEFNVRLADFGLAKHIGAEYDADTSDMTRYYTYHKPGHQYAIAWWAPECFGSDGEECDAIFSTNSDVYSFGVLIWQCLAGRDPFDDATPKTDSSRIPDQDAAKLIRRIRDECETPNIHQLREDTPEELIDLLKECWDTDPEKRPTMPLIIERLNQIKSLPARRARHPGVRKARAVKKKWHDIKPLYRIARLDFTEEQANQAEEYAHSNQDSFERHGSFAHQNYMQQLKSARHLKAPSLVLDFGMLRHLHACQPRDVFLVHTGVQKKEQVATMEDILQTGGFECFLDKNMMNADGAPTEQMANALERCRHAIVVLSKAFLEKRHPCAELEYVFKRNEWLRQQNYGWESMWIVLYDLTVDEYSLALDSPLCSWSLPKLGPRVVMVEWKGGSGQYETWPHLCHELKCQLIQHDNAKAVQHWKKFLRDWEALPSTGFPFAKNLYAA
jgi:TPR repeat protein/serine/threonine protein kinase